MATNASPKPPSFVFGYLPKQDVPTPAITDSSISLYDRTSAFLSAFAGAITPNPKLSIDRQRSATLQQVKAGLEGYLDVKRRAGIAISSSEQMDVARVEEAIRGFSTDA